MLRRWLLAVLAFMLSTQFAWAAAAVLPVRYRLAHGRGEEQTRARELAAQPY